MLGCLVPAINRLITARFFSAALSDPPFEGENIITILPRREEIYLGACCCCCHLSCDISPKVGSLLGTGIAENVLLESAIDELLERQLAKLRCKKCYCCSLLYIPRSFELHKTSADIFFAPSSNFYTLQSRFI